MRVLTKVALQILSMQAALPLLGLLHLLSLIRQFLFCPQLADECQTSALLTMQIERTLA